MAAASSGLGDECGGGGPGLLRVSSVLIPPQPPVSLLRALPPPAATPAKSTDTSVDQSTLMDQPSSTGSTSSQEDMLELELHLLPPDILQDIFSKLSIKEVVRMSILSVEWRRLRICHPDLVFTEDTFLGSNTSRNTDLQASTAEFIAKVDTVLHPLWSTSTTTATTLNKFVVKFRLGRSHKDHIDRWIRFSTASRAKHIGLVFMLRGSVSAFETDKYVVPLCNLSGPTDSVESLDLCYVCLKLPPSFRGIRNLKKLTLHTVSVSLSDFQCLLLSCSLLESLHIEWLSQERCTFPNYCMHQELCRLQYLRTRECDLELNAPNLTTIDFNDFKFPIVLSECLKLSEATFTSHRRYRNGVRDALGCVFDDVLTNLPHVHRLFLDLGLETSVRSFSKTQTRFMKLRYLNINFTIKGRPRDTSWVMGLVNLLELTPLLEELELHMDALGYCRPDSRLVKAVQGHTHRHLRSVYMTGFCSLVGVAELALYILGNATVLERMVVDSMVRIVYRDPDTDQLYSVSKASEFVPPGLHEQESYGMKKDREFAKEHLEREEYRHILTIL